MAQAGRRALRPRRGQLGLISNIYEIWETSGRTYGADRVHRPLRRDAALEYGIWSRDVRDGQLIHDSEPRVELHVIPLRRALTGQRNPALDGICRPLVRQDADGELLLNPEDRTRLPHELADRDEADNAIFAYVDGWYNTRRIQKELGYLSPNEYETAWHSRQTEPAEPTIATPAPVGSR